MKRVILFVLTNVAVLVVLSIVLRLTGLDRAGGAGAGHVELLLFSAVVGFTGSIISLLMSKSMAKWSTGAHVIEQPANDVESWLVATVQRLAQKAGIGMPEVAIYEGDPNAFATGAFRNSALVAVSTGLLQSMNKEEVEAVLAHEVAHVANGDMVTMTLVQGVVNAFVMFLARVIAFAAVQFFSRDRDENEGFSYGIYFMVQFAFEIVFMLLGTIVIAWFSRMREFRADAGGAQIGGRERMIGALEALQRTVQIQDPHPQPAIATLKISNPNGVMRFFSTHPPLEERIARLRSAA